MIVFVFKWGGGGSYFKLINPTPCPNGSPPPPLFFKPLQKIQINQPKNTKNKSTAHVISI